MNDEKKHLKIDLEFLDKKESIRVVPKKPEPPKGNEPNWRFYNPNNVNSKSGKQYNWKIILIIGGIGLFILIAIVSSDNSSTDTVSNGHYSCSQYDSDQADRLDPDLSGSQKQALTNRQNSLLARSNTLDTQKAQIGAEYVDETNQSSIDAHNARIDSFNADLHQYQADAQSLSDAIDTYNASQTAHDNYLTQHCTAQ